MLTISLNDLSFQGYHGVYDQEKIIGNQFIVNCTVKIKEPRAVTRALDQTVNYQALFELIRENMRIAEPLLETVCMKIGRLIFEAFPQVSFVSISIKKMNPPINGFSGNAAVCWEAEN